MFHKDLITLGKGDKIMNRVLVIHPKDESTDCLSVIYKDRSDCDVITDIHTSDQEVRKAIQEHDVLIFLGHGTPGGLLCGDGRLRFARYIINKSHIPLLKDKTTFSIWCNSDEFFEMIPGKGGKGLHTRMIISELGEEYGVLGHAPLNVEEMANNMELFCGAFAKHMDTEHPEEMRRKVLEEYIGDDEVTKFNRERIVVL